MMGRPTIFGRANGKRVQGVLTEDGTAEFEMHRTALALIYRDVTGRAMESVSDANTIEFLARGVQKTKRYLREQLAQR